MYIKVFTLFRIEDKTNNNKHVIYQFHSMQLQKEVKSNPKEPSCKKCAAPKNTVMKKDVKSKVVGKKWL